MWHCLASGSSKARLLLTSAHSSLAPVPPQLCSVCPELSPVPAAHTHRAPLRCPCGGWPGLCWPFQEPWAALEMPPCHPTSAARTLHRWYFWHGSISLLFGFSPGQACFSGMRRSCCGCIECWFWGISNSQKGACSSGYAHFKMCVYEFKVTNFFCLGVLFLDSFFFPQISPVMSWSFDSPPDKIVPVREAVLWDSFWKLFREITVGFLRNLVRAWKDHRKVFFFP